MNPWSLILLQARRSLIILGSAVLLFIAAVYGSGRLADNLSATAAATQSNLQVQNTLLEARRSDLTNVRDHIQAFESLRQRGLIGAGERALWVEQLQASYKKLGLPGSIGVQLQVAKALAAADAAPDAAPPPEGSPEETPIVPMAHDLQLEVRSVHEGELLDLLREFRNHVKGRFRVNACSLRDPAETGLSAQCVLRFVTVPVTPVANAASGP